MRSLLIRHRRHAVLGAALVFSAGAQAEPSHSTAHEAATAPVPAAAGSEAVAAARPPWAPQALHLDIRVIADRVTVRSRTVYGAADHPPASELDDALAGSAFTPNSEQDAGAGRLSPDPCGDLRPAHAQILEAGDRRGAPVREAAFAADARLIVETVEETRLAVRGSRRRLALPLAGSLPAADAIRFSAQVSVAADGPLVGLGSATHAAEVELLGETLGRLVVAGKAGHAASFFAFEFEVGTFAAVRPADPTRRVAWGGEAWARGAR